MDKAIQEYKEMLGVSRSPATARTYGVALDHLGAYIEAGGIEAAGDIHPGHFMVGITEGRASRTVGLYMSVLAQFAEFCYEEGYLENGDYLLFRRRLKRLRGRTVERKLPTVPTEDVFEAVLTAAYAQSGNTITQNLSVLRNIAIVETLRSTGCRVAELVHLRRRHLAEGRAKVLGKGRKARIVYFDKVAENALARYLDLREDKNPESPVFARHDRQAKGLQAMSTTSVRKVINRLAEQAGVDPILISPHKYRHRMATRILQGTGNLPAVQDLLGHSDPATTRVYTQLADADLRAVHGSVSL